MRTLKRSGRVLRVTRVKLDSWPGEIPGGVSSQGTTRVSPGYDSVGDTRPRRSIFSTQQASRATPRRPLRLQQGPEIGAIQLTRRLLWPRRCLDRDRAFVGRSDSHRLRSRRRTPDRGHGAPTVHDSAISSAWSRTNRRSISRSRFTVEIVTVLRTIAVFRSP